MYQPKKHQGTAQSKFCLYYGEDKHCPICLNSDHMVEQYQLILQEIRTETQQHREYSLVKGLKSTVRLSTEKDGSCIIEKRADHYLAQLYQDPRVVADKKQHHIYN